LIENLAGYSENLLRNSYAQNYSFGGLIMSERFVNIRLIFELCVPDKISIVRQS